MPKRTDRARKAGEPGRGHATPHGESQRESSARMAGQRVANRKRMDSKPGPPGAGATKKRPKR